VVGDDVASVEPVLLERVLDAGFDFVGNVAVDLDDSPVEAVSEPSGLGNLGQSATCRIPAAFVRCLEPLWRPRWLEM
jgi:hypothetical protein